MPPKKQTAFGALPDLNALIEDSGVEMPPMDEEWDFLMNIGITEDSE